MNKLTAATIVTLAVLGLDFTSDAMASIPESHDRGWDAASTVMLVVWVVALVAHRERES